MDVDKHGGYETPKILPSAFQVFWTKTRQLEVKKVLEINTRIRTNPLSLIQAWPTSLDQWLIHKRNRFEHTLPVANVEWIMFRENNILYKRMDVL